MHFRKSLSVLIQDMKLSLIVSLLFAPLINILVIPVTMIVSLWNAHVVFLHPKRYDHFNPSSGLTTYFYKTQFFNLRRFSRRGASPYIGVGDFSMKHFFHLDYVASAAYMFSSNIVLLVGMFGFLLAHMIWVWAAPWQNVLVVMLLLFLSATFYAHLFFVQNYNVIGWMFFPLAMYALLTNTWWLLGLSWFLISFGSISILFIGAIISFFAFILQGELLFLLAMIPSIIKIAIQLLPTFFDGISSLMNAMRFIGLFSDRKTKYARHLFSQAGLREIFLLLLYGQFLLFYVLFGSGHLWLYIVALALFSINGFFSRFADVQTMQLLMCSIAAALTIVSFHPVLLLSYLFLVSPPMMLFLGMRDKKRKFILLPHATKPFPTDGLLQKCSSLFAPVQKDERVLFVYTDPQGIYGNILKDYRGLNNLFMYVATRRSFLIFPNEWAAEQLNYVGAPEIWGDSLLSITKNVRSWKAQYVLVYEEKQRRGALLDKLKKAGFTSLKRLDWSAYGHYLQGLQPYAERQPSWHLLRAPK